MKVKSIPSSWVHKSDYRFDCNPYMSGAVEAREALEASSLKMEKLVDLVVNGGNGLVNPGRVKRTWVQGEKYGKKFLTSTDIQKFKSSGDRYISFRAIEENKKLIIKQDWTLITRAGSIGRMAYARSEMDGLACTEDVLRVIPDQEKIPAGYLFSYLRSQFGVSLIVSSTYGAIIQHIEPHHLEDLPVPRLGQVLESKIDSLVKSACRKRSEANEILDELTRKVEELIGVTEFLARSESSFSVNVVRFPTDGRRLDAFHHAGYVREGVDSLQHGFCEAKEIATLLRPPLMKRQRVSEGGLEFLGGGDLHTLEQEGSARISTGTRSLDQYIVREGMVLFQCVGQRYGIFGRPILANRRLYGKAVTEAVMRIIPNDEKDAGYISVYLDSDVGRRNALAWSAGTSIPVLQEVGAKKIRIYWPDQEVRWDISEHAEKAWELRCQATDHDEEAISLVEEAINKSAADSKL